MNDDDITKPADCTCRYPAVLARNGSGHALSCPAHRRWAAAIMAECAVRDALDACAPAPQARRGAETWELVEADTRDFPQGGVGR